MQRIPSGKKNEPDNYGSPPSPTSPGQPQNKLWRLITGLGKNAKTETFWLYLFLFVIIVCSTLLKHCYDFQTSPLTAHIKKGSLSDMWITVLAAIIFAGIQKLIRITLKEKVLVIINVKNASLNQEKRSQEYCQWIFDTAYYSMSSIWAFFLLRAQNFNPEWFGGPSNGCSAIFDGYPNKPEIPYMDLFYLIQLGDHLNSFVYQLLFKRSDKQYYEYTLHHGCAMFLIFFSYLMNYQAIGTIVLIIHDPCDVLLIISRSYLDYKLKQDYIAASLAGTFIVSWIYLRIIVFPICCIRAGFDYSFRAFNSETGIGHVGGWPFFGLSMMMTVLFIMHCFWISVILKSAFDMITKKKRDAHRTNYDE